MENKKKKLMLASAIGLFAVTLAMVFMADFKQFGKQVLGDELSYTLNTGTCTEAEVSAKQFVRNTSEGNPITFKMTGTHTFNQYSISNINATGSGNPSASVYNETPITGLYQMTFSADNSTYYKCFYGSSLDNLEYATKLIKDRVGETITINFEGVNIQHFKLVRVNVNGKYDASYLKPISLKYKCSNIVSRGESYENGTSINLAEDFSNNGTFAFDYKATSGSTLRICFMDRDWAKYFGYMSLSADGTQIYGSTKREHEYGIRTSPLSDGYVHVTIDFTKFGMTNGAYNRDNVPSSIGVVLISGCDSAGFIDVLPTTHAFEGIVNNHAVTSTGSTQAINLPFVIDYSANMEIVVDMVYDDPTKKLTIGFGSFSGYYGYYNLLGSDNRISLGGYVEHVSNTHLRFIFDLDDLAGTSDVLGILFVHSASLATGTLNFYINL